MRSGVVIAPRFSPLILMIVLLRDSGLRILMTRWFQSRERKGGVDRAASGRIGAAGGGFQDIFIGWIKAIEKMSGIKVLAEAKTPGLVGWVTKFLSTDAAKKFVPEPEVSTIDERSSSM
ncbi:hypothetical protein ACET3Z_003532 [Daucus carota]